MSENTPKHLGVVLLSGGLDSCVTAAIALKRMNPLDKLVALSVDYGQRHRVELDAAAEVARHFGIEHQVATVPVLHSAESALTNPDIQVPVGRSTKDMASEIPVTYVPMRNTVLLSLAAAWLESGVMERRERGLYVWPSIWIGANVLDYSGYPDCRPVFLRAMEEALRKGSSALRSVSIMSPLITFTKLQIVAAGIKHGAPMGATWSCYLGGDEEPCGECDSCLLRAEAFEKAGIPDPATEPRPVPPADTSEGVEHGRDDSSVEPSEGVEHGRDDSSVEPSEDSGKAEDVAPANRLPLDAGSVVGSKGPARKGSGS